MKKKLNVWVVFIIALICMIVYTYIVALMAAEIALYSDLPFILRMLWIKIRFGL